MIRELKEAYGLNIEDINKLKDIQYPNDCDKEINELYDQSNVHPPSWEYQFELDKSLYRDRYNYANSILSKVKRSL